MAIRAVLWDVDDTIFDYTSADRAGMRVHLEAEGLLHRYGTAEQALGLWREITDRQWLRFANREATFEEQRIERVREFLEERLSDADAEAWFLRYVAHYEAAWSLFPDVVPVLDALSPAYDHAVLSNSSIHNQDRKLRILGVHDRFSSILCAAELGVSKPEPGAFHAACEALSLEPHEVLYVGDHPDIDATGAAAAGLAAVWLDRPDVGGRPELIRITGLDQLPDLLRGNTRFGAPSTFG
ncbi:HAD family hydrolase [Streptomyces sp. NPDC050738]|uniref:HAD family hydrolase n=1 Tax=Streptomyces sp. NPDC050738 TaxID=3154744 RepID=UPI00343E2E59